MKGNRGIFFFNQTQMFLTIHYNVFVSKKYKKYIFYRASLFANPSLIKAGPTKARGPVRWHMTHTPKDSAAPHEWSTGGPVFQFR